jgi:hypothetical protein
VSPYITVGHSVRLPSGTPRALTDARRGHPLKRRSPTKARRRQRERRCSVRHGTRPGRQRSDTIGPFALVIRYSISPMPYSGWTASDSGHLAEERDDPRVDLSRRGILARRV